MEEEELDWGTVASLDEKKLEAENEKNTLYYQAVEKVSAAIFIRTYFNTAPR